jgi:hypothetical protein
VRPAIRPSRMGLKTEPLLADNAAKRGIKLRKRKRLVIHEEPVILADVPTGSPQALRGLPRPGSYAATACRAHPPGALADARMASPTLAPVPDGIAGYFGPDLRRIVLLQIHQGLVTMPSLAGHLRAVGIAIAKSQVVRLLNVVTGHFVDEVCVVLLETAPGSALMDRQATPQILCSASSLLRRLDWQQGATVLSPVKDKARRWRPGLRPSVTSPARWLAGGQIGTTG